MIGATTIQGAASHSCILGRLESTELDLCLGHPGCACLCLPSPSTRVTDSADSADTSGFSHACWGSEPWSFCLGGKYYAPLRHLPWPGCIFAHFSVLYLTVSSPQHWHHEAGITVASLLSYKTNLFHWLLSGSETWAELEPHLPPVPGSEGEFQILWSSESGGQNKQTALRQGLLLGPLWAVFSLASRSRGPVSINSFFLLKP